ncbi:MAG: hypothetical protein KC615_00610 [Anaerolineae bacterium]|nr:hypothetical protein [Anaerolineae bacterium]
MPKKKRKQQTTPPTVITLTMPDEKHIQRSGTLLIRRGDLAKLCQFHYTNTGDIASAIDDAMQLLTDLEQNPPDTSAAKSAIQPESTAESASVDEEPTIDVPLKKGTLAVKISHIKITGGESDAAAYRQATLLAGRLIDGGLWDGKLPIRFEDVHAVAKKMKPLTDKDFSMFTLEDFVQVGNVEVGDSAS